MRGVSSPEFNSLENLLLGFHPESGKAGHPALLTSTFQCLDGGHFELLPQDLDLLGTEPREIEHFNQALWNRGSKRFHIRQATRAHQFGHFLLQGLSESLEFSQPTLRHHRGKITLPTIQGSRRIDIGTGLEWVFALEFKQHRDLLQRLDHRLFVHDRNPNRLGPPGANPCATRF